MMNPSVARVLKASAWGLLLVQGFHMFEHTLQQFQHFGGWFLVDGHTNGLLGDFVDFEWLHFVFNYLLWGFRFTLMIVFAAMPAFWVTTPGWIRSTFLVGCVVQTYHALEHMIRMHIWITTGVVDTRGIFGHIEFLATPKDTLVFGHWLINSIVYFSALPLTIYTIRGRFQSAPAQARGEQIRPSADSQATQAAH